MESAARLDQNHQLTLKEFPYIIQWREDRCTRCGRCTAVAGANGLIDIGPVRNRALELAAL